MKKFPVIFIAKALPIYYNYVSLRRKEFIFDKFSMQKMKIFDFIAP